MGSSNGRFLLGMLLGLLCGGGLYHLLSGSSAATAAEVADLSREDAGLQPDAPANSTTSATDSALPQTSTSSARELVHAREAADVDPAKVRELIADLDLSAATRDAGNGAIHGRVTDENDQGLAGVVLRLQKNSSSSNASSTASVGADAPELETLEEAVHKAAVRFEQNRADMLETKSDATGNYRFDGLTDEQWRVDAYLKGYELTAEQGSWRVRVGSQVDFSAEHVVEIAAKIYGADGALAHSAYIRCNRQGSKGRGKRYAWKSEAAFVRLTPGKYEVTAFSDDGGSTDESEFSSEMQEITVEAGATMLALRFDLRGRLGIRGTVRLTKGDLGKDNMIGVQMLPLSPTQEVDLELLANSDKRAFVSPGGEFNFPDLEAGRYLVGATRGWNTPVVVHRVVEVTTGTVRCDLDLRAVNLERYLRVTVLGPDGETVDDVDFSVRVNRGNMSDIVRAETIRDKDRAYLLGFGDKDAKEYFGETDSDGKFRLMARHEEYGSREVELARGQTELTISFGVPGTLTATVVGYQGSGYEGRLQIEASKKNSGQQALYSMFGQTRGVLNAEGVQEIKGLEPGLYSVKLSARAKGSSMYSFQSNQIDSIEMEILAGPNAIQLRIPTLFTLRMHWADGKEGANVYLQPADGADQFGFRSVHATLDAAGYATFEDVRAGEYMLSVHSGTAQQMKVVVPSKDIEFVPMKINALRIVISDENGDLAKLGFLTGDLIVGSDGKEFGAVPPSYALLATLQSSKTAEMTFMIERAGKRLEIHAKGSDVGDWSKLGGMLMPAQR